LSDDGYNYLDIVREKKAAEEVKIQKIAEIKKASKDKLVTDWMVCICMCIYV
jgi:hypothetical protein